MNTIFQYWEIALAWQAEAFQFGEQYIKMEIEKKIEKKAFL